MWLPSGGALTLAVLATTAAASGRAWRLCYICTSTDPSSNCALRPDHLESGEGFTNFNCSRSYCTISRIDRPPGTVWSIGRGCENKVDPDGRCTHSHGVSRECGTKCTGDLCNGGDGLHPDTATAPRPGSGAAHRAASGSTFGGLAAVLAAIVRHRFLS